ncbi:MAG: hypothetical protein C5B54_04105 [Acidobacteria bacterium]|nr:MAG: hypothetical protein C5B54_04105 [Acidobacteriota bacterium]
MPEMALRDMHEGENLAAQRPDLFGYGKAMLTVPDGKNWKLVYPDEIAREIESLNRSDARAMLLPYAGSKRWEVENGGITADGRRVRTDIDSQVKVANLKTAYDNGTITGTVNFKLADDSFIEADRATIDGIYAAILNHIENCFDAEQQARVGIEQMRLTTFAQVDQVFTHVTNNRKK